MNIKTKIKLSNLTLSVVTFMTFFIIIWFIIFLISTVFKLNVFAEKTTEFYYLTILAALAIIASCAILSTTINISMIADSKIKEMKLDRTLGFGKKYWIGAMTSLIVLIAFLFTGDFISRSHSKRKLINESSDIVQRYHKSIDELPALLADTSKIGKIPSLLKFLSNQKKEFPTVILITSSEFDGQLAYLKINKSMTQSELKQPYYNDSFYECDKKDCEYLESVFTKGNNSIYCISEGADYRLYYPYVHDQEKLILLFTRYSRYGKIGS
ncbi:hypothetical protein JW835_01650 [bacterium]|nr:hypothetical protein [bacterium]